MKPRIYAKEFQLSIVGSEGVIDERRAIRVDRLGGSRVGIYLREYVLMQNGAFEASSSQVCIPHDVAREMCNAILSHIGDGNETEH